jgi:hypothetical protein
MEAIDLYQEVIGLDANHLLAKLGLAWCVDQAGERDKAITAYRQVIRDAWPRERNLTTAGVGWHSVTAEAAGYLTRLLDPEKDKEEIATLRQQAVQMSYVLRAITPVVVPLRDVSNASDLGDQSAHVLFDADGTGLRKSWTWVNKDAGWLVYTPRGKQVTSALQMFGDVTFWLFWGNGYQAMRALDDDGDGALSGSELVGLSLWQDLNGDGTAQPEEVQPVAKWGIVSLSCLYEWDEPGTESVASSRAGVTFVGGLTRPTYDIVLHSASPFSPIHAAFIKELPVHRR